MLAGKATASDLAAGLALGQAVAAVLVTRARADGMATAGGSPALWAALADGAGHAARSPWLSQDLPARPPMLPAFGAVRGWMMTPEDFVRERPGPPPSTSSTLMARETEEVRQYVDTGTRDELAIANFWADGPSTPTPPGHWNFIAHDYIRKADMSEVRAARAFALLNMAMHDAAVGCWETKYFYFNPRPSQMDPELKTIIGLPELPVVYVRPLHVLGRGRDCAVVSLPERDEPLRGAGAGGLDVAALRRHPLPFRPRSRQSARQAHRRLQR